MKHGISFLKRGITAISVAFATFALSTAIAGAQVGDAWNPPYSPIPATGDDPYGTLHNGTATFSYNGYTYQIEWVGTYGCRDGTGDATVTAQIDNIQFTTYMGFAINGVGFNLSDLFPVTYALDKNVQNSVSTSAGNNVRYLDLNMNPGTSSGWWGTGHVTYNPVAFGTGKELYPYYKFKVTKKNATAAGTIVTFKVAQGGTAGIGYVNQSSPQWRVSGLTRPSNWGFDSILQQPYWWNGSLGYDTGVRNPGNNQTYWYGWIGSSDHGLITPQLVKSRVGDFLATVTLQNLVKIDDTHFDAVGYCYVQAKASTPWNDGANSSLPVNAPQYVTATSYRLGNYAPGHPFVRNDMELIPFQITADQ